ncbi:4-alpha-glucanotransferase [Pelagicoccus sp. SDUM812003]|uniref:4-alpha-glucanotransferase n=1 Tax=Pelagicoccus sp. SDUM812003 TaxID=3041267 RepID=UPI00280F91FC|nr:4-alpha-glucanotransferase [Pelagicoccus sp. SDUM812003]MDQ8205332.1 4-alpha-glucanotransferase [Pelagicoccus sp. SDUM812003]
MKDPLFNWLDHRAAGVLLHPTSLPGEYGVGTFNNHCFEFIDFLAEAGFKYWQICPLGPTSYGDSPYQSFSSFAGNPYLISLNALEAKSLLDHEILEELKILPNGFVDYGGLFMSKWPVLDAVYETFVRGKKKIRPYGSFSAYKKKNADWLEPYAYFQALKGHCKGQPWYHWPEDLRSFASAVKSPLRKKLERAVDAQMFYQYLFEGQWKLVRRYAETHGVSIIGDIPIFVALDSADVWQNPEYFQLDGKTSLPTAVAGCPPDYFSDDGQLWGNPLYDWDTLAKDDYSWWIRRFKRSFELYDVVRIDHFRGFDSYWSIPYGSETARTGEWVAGPGIDFFKAIKKKIRNCKLIAEDLGDLTDAVRELRRDTGLPGMAILQFAFGGEGDNFYLPHNHQANCVLYPGTHDNNTTLGWYAEASEEVRDHVRRYFNIDGSEVGWDLLRSCYKSVPRLAIVPFQDILSLGSEARFNTPGNAGGNWGWRYLPHQIREVRGGTAAYLKELSELYYRTGLPAVNTI